MTIEMERILESQRFFEKQHYSKTAEKIATLTGQVVSGQVSNTQEISTRMVDVFETFHFEFGKIIPVGCKYRRRCFRESQIIILQSFHSLMERRLSFPDEYSVFLDKMNASDNSINSMSELFSGLFTKQNRSNSESEIMFSSACHIYLVAVEGIFGEMAKLLFALMMISEGTNIPSITELSSEHVWKIYRECERNFGIRPIFLENWKEKNDIRNAIAHAQAQYDPVIDRVHFMTQNLKTGEVLYDRTMNFSEFFKIWLEIADAIDAFRYTLRLVSVMENLTTLLAH